ncbi:hypothetical protein FOPE_09743 [Fonsecaea pedrosoi]|nr:hypothetical protein FOPE_09743 [Fonsecaea pedrosoi]
MDSAEHASKVYALGAFRDVAMDKNVFLVRSGEVGRGQKSFRGVNEKNCLYVVSLSSPSTCRTWGDQVGIAICADRGGCTRLGRSCPGYRDEFDLVFRVQSPSSFAQSANRDRRRKRISPPCSSGPKKSSSHRPNHEGPGDRREKDNMPPMEILDPDVVVFSGWYLFPTRQLAECWDSHAYTLAFSNLIGPQRHSATSELVDINFLSGMVSEAGQDSSIVLACRAIGHAFLTRNIDTPETRSKRAATYGQALKATNMALEHPVLQTQDETLASVWLLSLYEVSRFKWLLKQ